jgi:hypothetical protein
MLPTAPPAVGITNIDEGLFIVFPLVCAFKVELLVADAGVDKTEDDEEDDEPTAEKNEVMVLPLFNDAGCFAAPILFRPTPPSSLVPVTEIALPFPLPSPSLSSLLITRLKPITVLGREGGG